MEIVDIFKYVFFGIGTAAFFVTVYFSVQNPELVDSADGESKQDVNENPLRKWDSFVAWVMWGGWAMTGLVFYGDRVGYLEILGLK
ncbi:MAG: hypothetical protein ACJAVI_003428 [Candidatus Azotimanducaceae bacterium]|jgi:hypothetical protein